MILPIHTLVRSRMAEAVSRLYGLPADDPVLTAIPVEPAPRRALGDLAVPLAFELARRLRKAPRAIAQEIVGALGTIDGFSRIEAAPNGYVNFFLDRPVWMRQWLTPRSASAASGGKAIVEHTAINPNKAAHIGHLRNAALGDTLRAPAAISGTPGRNSELHRRYRRPGRRCRGRLPRARSTRRSTRCSAIADAGKFDYYCWDLYARRHRVVCRQTRSG